MKNYRKIFHSTLEINADVIGYYLVITEVSKETNNVIGSWIVRLPDWVADFENQEYEFYQPIFN